MSNFTDDLTHTRGTGATRTNPAGLIVGVDFSSTSVTIGTGAKTFTFTADANVNRDWPVGSVVRVVDQVSANTMEGTVTTYTPSTQELVLDIASVTGSGTFTNWRIGSLEVRRDADGVLREPLRSNEVFPSEVNSAAARNSVGNPAGYAVFDGTVSAQQRSGVQGLNVIPAVSIDANGFTGAGTVPFSGLLYGRGTTSSNKPLSIFINPLTWNFDIYVGALPTDGNTTFIAGASHILVFSGGQYVGPSNFVKQILSDGTYHLHNIVASNAGAHTGILVHTRTAGDGAKQFWAGGFQQENTTNGSSTSYIPTTTVAVTRNADTFTFTPAAIAKFRQGQGALIVEANASDAGTAQRAALRLTGPSGEIRLGKQGVATSGNFAKMAEGGDVQLLGNATQGITNNGLEYGLVNPTRSDTGIALGAANLNTGAYNGTNEFGALAFTSSEVVLNSALSTIDFKGMNPGHVLNGAHHNGSRFIVATGAVGAVVLSTDGLSYRRVNTPVITQPCNEVTSGMVGPTLRNVIVGGAGFIATSDDNGETWVSRTSGTGSAINAVTRSTTNFVLAIGSPSSSTNIRTSTDGITWNAVANSGVGNSLLDVHANGAQVVAVGGGGAITVSNDNGATWAAATSSGVVTTQSLNGVHYNASANLWVAVGNSGTIITATDPTGTWTLRTSNTAQTINEVNYFNNAFIAVTSTGRYVFSSNGITWTEVVIAGTNNLIGIAASGTRLIVTGAGGSLFSSEDGLTYTSRTNNNATLNGIAYGAGVYVSVGNAVNGSGYIATIDGAGTVTRRVSSTTQSLLNAKFVRSAHYAVGNASVLSRSTDGATWSTQTIGGTAFNIQDIADSGTLMIAVGSGGRYSTSANGTTFANSALNGQTTQQLNGIEFANGSFVIIGNAGVILTTTDGATYTRRTSGTTQNLTSVMYSTRDQRWYAAGNAGTLLYSEDNGVTWASVNNAGFGAVSNTTLQVSKLLQQWKSGSNTMALSYKANEVIVGLNGVATTDTTASIPSITGGVLGESFNGKIKSAKFQPNPLTAAEVVAITGVTR